MKYDEKEVRELAEEHFSYIEKVLKAHNEDDDVISKIRFHYVEAMIHGFKHCVERIELK
jgi:hypothetical protein